MRTRIRPRLLFASGYMTQFCYPEVFFSYLRLYPYISIDLWTVHFSSNLHL